MRLSSDVINFAEWNPNPIIKLNAGGEVVYANLMARTQFPDIITLALNHPLLKGLEDVIRDFQPDNQSEVIVYDRDIDINTKCYEQQIFGFPNTDIYVYIVDVTERKQLMAQAHFNDKLATIGTLAAGVAHEINNPITWVLGNAELLQDLMSQLKSILLEMDQREQVHTLMNKIDEAIVSLLNGAEQVRDITQSIKGLSRIDKKEMIQVDVHKVLKMAITMASLEFKERANLETHFSKQMPVIFSNPGRLHQIFVNLLINAAQAIPEGDLANNHIIVSTSVGNNRVKIDVEDTGKGIPADVLPKIFDPFFTTKPSDEGTGLGLSVCQDIIRELKGEIAVKSEEGKGTIFSVYLPFSASDFKQQETERVVHSAKMNKRILIVDNEPLLLKLMQRIFEGTNQTTVVSSGRDAIELIAKNGKSFDVIITDLNMPDITGLDLYQYAAEKFPGLEQRFIFVTGGVNMPWVKEFLATTRNPVLEKPFLPKDILRIVESMSIQ
jgi:signal transduction histidine kinase